MKTYKGFGTKETPQTEPIPGSNQIKNSAGGYVWAIDKWSRLDRFLILGSEGGTYYTGERELTKKNALSAMECIKEDGPRAVNRILEISTQGRAPKNDPALFLLAMAGGVGDKETRRLVFSESVLPNVARIGTHLFHFAEYCKQFRGRGRLFREGIQRWYQLKSPRDLAYQAVKYQQRDGWSHRDLLRLSKPVPQTDEHSDIYGWIVGKNKNPKAPLLVAYEEAQRAEGAKQIIELILNSGLTREMIPTKWLNVADVWAALLEDMPMTALIRNLGKMTSIGLLKPMSKEVSKAIEKITNEEAITRSRIHPLSILVALNTYNSGGGFRGSLTWSPVSQIVDALNDAFYYSFGNIVPTEKRIMLALDVSGSMASGNIAGMPNITPRVASACMAMITAQTEKNWMMFGFSHKYIPLSISPKQRLDDVIKSISGIPFGGTDASLPMKYALENQIPIDAFFVYTDNETWRGEAHAKQRLDAYRQKMGIPAKLVSVAMTATHCSIADPNDSGMLDVVGFDTAAPNIMGDFIRE